MIEKVSNISINKKINKSFSFRTFLSTVMSLYLKDKDINFLTDSKTKQKQKFKLGTLFLASALSFVLVVSYFIYSKINEKSSIVSNISSIDLYLNNEQNKISNNKSINLQKSVSVLEQYKKDAEDVKLIINHEDIVHSNIIQSIFSALPKGSKINSMSLTKGQLSLDCESPSMIEVGQFEKNLREINFIYSVYIPATTELNGIFSYSVNCSLKDVNQYEAK